MKCPTKDCDHDFSGDEFQEIDFDESANCPKCKAAIFAHWDYIYDEDSGDEWPFIDELYIKNQNDIYSNQSRCHEGKNC